MQMLEILAYAGVKLGLWLVFVLWVFAFGRKLIRKMNEPEADLGDLLWKHRIKVCATVVVGVLLTLGTNLETAYRPKTVLEGQNIVLQERLTAPAEPIAILPPPPKVSVAERVQQNRDENQAAIKAFMENTPKSP